MAAENAKQPAGSELAASARDLVLNCGLNLAHRSLFLSMTFSKKDERVTPRCIGTSHLFFLRQRPAHYVGELPDASENGLFRGDSTSLSRPRRCRTLAIRVTRARPWKLAKARCDTLRLRLLKIGAAIHVTVRKVWVALAEGYPYRDLFAQVYAHLRACGDAVIPRHPPPLPR